MTSTAIVPRRHRNGLARFAWTLGVVAVLLTAATQGGAQERQVDPRVGLAAGFRDAGEAAHNMELVVNLPKPDGFFDPEAPAAGPGRLGPPEPEENEEATPPEDAPEADAAPAEDAPEAPSAEERRSRISYSNSDIAFSDTHMFVGNYHGFNTYSLEDPRELELLVSVVCPGGQGDVSVYGDLLFMSVPSHQRPDRLRHRGVEDPVSNERFRGVRIFDISDIRNPQQIAAVQTCRGSHTHTLVPDPNDPANLYVYGSGTSSVRSGDELAGCVDLEEDQDPNENPDLALFSIDVIQVPLAAPETARIVNRPRIFADPETGSIAGLWQGGDHGEGTQNSRRSTQCHDHHRLPGDRLGRGCVRGQRHPSGYLRSGQSGANGRGGRPELRLLAFGDVQQRRHEGGLHRRMGRRRPAPVPRHRPADLGCRRDLRHRRPQARLPQLLQDAGTPDRTGELRRAQRLAHPRAGSRHHGAVMVPGRRSVFDFTDSANPIEIAFFDRGPLDSENLIMGGYWSSYWYNGYIYAAEISRGVDVFALTPGEHLSQNEIDASNSIELSEFNVQQQVQFHWPDSAAVARAYVDQLTRSHNIRGGSCHGRGRSAGPSRPGRGVR